MRCVDNVKDREGHSNSDGILKIQPGGDWDITWIKKRLASINTMLYSGHEKFVQNKKELH